MRTKEEVVNDFLERRTPEEQAIRAELEGLWEEGYNAGILYNEKKINEEGNRQYNHGYANGVVAGKEMVLPGVDIYKEGYDKGADDARYVLWWAVSKVILSPDRGGLGGIAVEKIFNTYFLEDIFMNFTPEEIIEKVKDYKEGPKKSAPTNRDKFEEVFGFRPEEHRNSLVIMAENGDLRKIILDKPYEEPADGN